MSNIATTIYLDRKQRQFLFNLAKKHGSSFSQEVRNAVDTCIAGDEGIDLDELSRLAKEADAAIDRTVRKMDDAIAYLSKITAKPKTSPALRGQENN